MNVDGDIPRLGDNDGSESSQTIQTELEAVNDSYSEDEEEDEEEQVFDEEKDTSESDNEDQAEDNEDDEDVNTDEESVLDDGGGGEVEEAEEGESSENEAEEYSMSEEEGERNEDEEDAVTEDSPKTSSSAAVSESVSPVEGEKRGRGRPKKVLNNSDILDALDESFQAKPKRKRNQINYGSDNNEEDSEYEDGKQEEEIEEEEDEDEDEDERPAKKSRYVENEGIRRSARERKTPKKFEAVLPEKKKRKKRVLTSESEGMSGEDSDEDYTSHKKYHGYKRKKKRKKQDKFNIYKKSPTKVKRKQKKVQSEEEGDSAALTDESDNEYSRSWRKKMKRKKGKGEITLADYGGDKKSARVRKTTKYREEETSHESDIASDFDPKEAVEIAADEEEIETIEFVLDHRQGKVGATGNSTMYWAVKDNGDPNESLETSEMEQQYLIKWKGWSHINNTWESQTSVDAKKKGSLEVKGMRRLINYQQKLSDFNSWKKRANPEDIEYQEIEIEMGRQMLVSYTEIERIFSQRKNENNTNDYFVKWRNLAYVDATWEDESVIKTYYTEALAEYNARKKAKCNPRSYKESMKFFKKTFKPLKDQPSFIGSESLRLRDYQMDGLNFMLKAWHNGDSLILADEMGLGKTIQSISFLKYLFHVYPFKGPMLVVVPLSTMAAWQKEFATWAPEINTICYNGSTQSREVIRQFELENTSGELTFNALLTNYEMVCKDRTFFQDIVWSNIVVDEAHRLKNKESLLYNVLTTIDSHHRLLLTGTPLQNSLKELWCLLSYLQLAVDNIETWETFEAQYGTAEERASGYVKLHSLLRPYIIRRMKKDVEKSLPPKVEQILRVDMTVRQKKVYKLVLTRNYEALAKGKNQVSLINIMMQLRKTCNHVELLQDQEEIVSRPEDRLRSLIYGSGKLLLLDKLLLRFREKGDRVLIFSQMVMMLNLLEDYMQLKRFPYQRLDGGVSADRRKQSIAQFNDPNSNDFCFLLSTKAGGLGINLQTANRVVIFDSDWNPQNDLQAIARAHRIGQKEEVKIFRFVASSSVDEDIIQRAKKKMVLDHLVIQSMDTTGKAIIHGKGDEKKGSVPFDKTELNMILKFGAEDLFKSEDAEEQDKEVDLDAILESAELREDEEAPQSEANKELLSAFKCTNIAFDEMEEEYDQEPEPEPVIKDWSEIIPSAMVEQHKTKTGIDMYSDPEELFNPIAMRKKRRRIKKRPADEDESATNSASVSRDGSEDEDVANDPEESVDSDMTDGEREIISTLKKKGYKKSSDRKYSKKTVQCLEPECTKQFVERKALKQHMVKFHQKTDFQFAPENKIQTSEKAGEKVDPELLRDLAADSSGKKKRGPPVANTRCFPCNKSFQHRLGYKNHLKKQHEGVEPAENRDPKNLALPDDRISCLICHKKFNSVPGLKGHIQNFHLGLNQPAKAKNDTEDEENDDVAAGGEQTGKTVTEAEAKQIERMYYMMRKYGCAFCPVRFNNKAKLQMHEKIHRKSKNKPVICPYCEKSYSKRDKLKKHIERVHPGKSMPAPSSPQKKSGSTPEKSQIQSPAKVKKKGPVGKTSPGPKGKVEITSITLNGHTKFKCPECGSLFSYQKGAMRHYKDFHLGEKKKRQEKNQAKLDPKPEVIDVEEGESENENEEEEEEEDGREDANEENGEDDEDEEEEAVEAKPKTYDCPFCDRVYTNANSLWAHKKAKHADLGQVPISSKVTKVPEKVKGGKEKEYVCPVCHKNYASYMSLYMHKKTKHPGILPSGGSNPPTTNDVQVLRLGVGALTPNGRREKIHQCAKCHKKYADLKGLANHIEKMHSKEDVAPAPTKDTSPACPYCENVYSRRDKLYEHIRKVHPGSEVPIMTRSPKCKISEPPPVLELDDGAEDSDQSNTDSNSGSGFGAGKIFVTPVKGRGNQGSQRGKYKKKDFTCHICHKGYCDASRLKNHIESKHEQKNDPWREVGPNTDIAVRSRTVREGFEVYKVLGVYSTGLRMKAARFVAVEPNSWRLTEDISKSLMKQDILAVVTSLKEVEAGLYLLDPQEMEYLQSLAGSRSPAKLRPTTVSEPKAVEMERSMELKEEYMEEEEKNVIKEEKEEENVMKEEEEDEEDNYMEEEHEFLKQNGLDHEVETFENNPEEEPVMVQPMFQVNPIRPEHLQL